MFFFNFLLSVCLKLFSENVLDLKVNSQEIWSSCRLMLIKVLLYCIWTHKISSPKLLKSGHFFQNWNSPLEKNIEWPFFNRGKEKVCRRERKGFFRERKGFAGIVQIFSFLRLKKVNREYFRDSSMMLVQGEVKNWEKKKNNDLFAIFWPFLHLVFYIVSLQALPLDKTWKFVVVLLCPCLHDAVLQYYLCVSGPSML